MAELPGRVAALGQKAVACTDHGALYGAVDFYKHCEKQGIKPIIGCEVYVAPRRAEDKTFPADINPYHLVLLVQNEEGYRNLVKLVSDSFLEGFYRKPRTDMEKLAQRSGGLFALSGCISGVLSKRIESGDTDGARETALKLKKAFEGRFFIEIQRNGVEGQNKVNHVLIKLARECDIPLVATNDVHYISKEDAETQELLMAISTGGTLGDKEFALPSNEFYLKSTEEMAELFKDIPDAAENTVKIADMCGFKFDFSSFRLPRFDPPNALPPAGYLRELCEEGLGRRLETFGKSKDKEAYGKRLEYELAVIHQMGFDDYFLVVHDFVAYAKRQGIPVGPGRGSAVGSLAAYSLGITDVDPIKYDLLFERFLNPERASMPDIDIDFCDERRGEVIEYVAGRYGVDHMAQIITFGTLQCRGAVRDVGRALGMSYADVDIVAKTIPRTLGITLDTALSQSPELKNAYSSDPKVKRLLDFAKKLEGRPRNASTHATGVVITDKPITNYLPLSVNDNAVVTQFDMNAVAELGLLKIDFLGLRYLTIIRDAEKLVKLIESDFDITTVSEDDIETYEMLSSGKTLGVFQLESEGMRSLLTKLAPKNFEDIITVISLYRPGPAQFIDEYLKNRASAGEIAYSTPLLKKILDPTAGCMLYQEQVMEVFRTLAGYSYGRADLIRRAMARKKHEDILREKEGFIAGSVKNGVKKKAAEEIFDSMAAFASYAFNKSHAAAYAVVSYRTAYLKCHYPTEYMCALLNSVIGDSAKINEYIAECGELGIRVLGPDVNESGRAFAIYEEHIRFGLAAIKNVGSNFAGHVEAERENGGKYKSFEDFICRVFTAANTKTLESLVLAGGCDCFGVYRSRMFSTISKALNAVSGMREEMKFGQISLFESVEENYSPLKLVYPNISEYPEKEILSFEKALTGVYFSGHPLNHYKKFAKSTNSVTIKDLYYDLKNDIIPEKQVVNLNCQIKQLRKKATKAGKLMAYLTAEDLTGEADVIVFPALLEKYSSVLAEGGIVLITGEAALEEPFGGEGEDVLKIVLRAVYPSKPDGEMPPQNADLYLKLTPDNKDFLGAALARIKENKGRGKLYIYDETKKSLSVSKDIFCNPAKRLVDELKEILGGENVAVKITIKDKEDK